MDLLRSRAVILAANKIDLARSRAVSTQGTLNQSASQIWLVGSLVIVLLIEGLSTRVFYSAHPFLFYPSTHADGKCLACTYRVKFIEVSVGINHNVDELLAGCLTQIRLKKEHNMIQVRCEDLYLHSIIFASPPTLIRHPATFSSSIFDDWLATPLTLNVKMSVAGDAMGREGGT